MSTAAEIVRLIENQAPTEAIGKALEGYALRSELTALEAIHGFSRVLDRLPLPSKVRNSPAWVSVLKDPVMTGSKARIAEINQRLAELAAPSN